MPPEPVTFPERRFVVTRVDDGVETNLISSLPMQKGYTSDQIVRKQTYQNVLDWLAANPGVHLRIYGPSDGGDHTDDDCIFDTEVCGGYDALLAELRLFV